jgi:hypothetical protein
VQEIYSDGSAHMTWWITKDGKCNPSKKWYRAYVDRDSDLGECYDMNEGRIQGATVGSCLAREYDPRLQVAPS